VQEWLNRTVKFLGEELGEEYVHRFMSNAGIAPLVLSVPTAPDRNKEIWKVLYYRSARLNQFLEEMT
jgi:hypothetical protein